jgi:hypothetical protein
LDCPDPPAVTLDSSDAFFALEDANHVHDTNPSNRHTPKEHATFRRLVKPARCARALVALGVTVAMLVAGAAQAAQPQSPPADSPDFQLNMLTIDPLPVINDQVTIYYDVRVRSYPSARRSATLTAAASTQRGRGRCRVARSGEFDICERSS